MKYIFLSFTVLVSGTMFAQSSGSGQFSASDGSVFFLGKKGDAAPEEIIGTPYYTESFSPAKVEGFDGIFMLRYNVAKDEMEYEKEKQIYYVTKNTQLQIAFTNINKKYQLLNYITEKGAVDGYLVILSENANVSLYKKENIKYIPKKLATNTYDTDKPAQYQKEGDTFFIKHNGVVQSFPKNKKELIRLFPQKEKELTEYLKQNKVSFNKEAGLVQLTILLNTF